jgi:hypothetical protein
LIKIGVIIGLENKYEVEDEKNIEIFFNSPFVSGFFGRRFSRRKDCAIKRARLFRLRLQGQDKFYPEKN